MNLQSIPFIRSPRFSDAALLILMLAILAVSFWPVISSPDKAISKLNMIASIDSWQNPGWKYPALYTGDCSSVVTHVPNEVFALSSQAAGEVPLWNNLSGCGRPFFAEFQTLAWSTYRKLFPASSAHAYELGLLFKLAASGVGMFLVARMIGFGSIAAFAAGTAFMFCPRCLNVLDLCGNYFFYPWIVLLFLWMSRRPCLLVTTLVGIVCGAVAYEMHPETFAFAILLGYVFSLSEAGVISPRLAQVPFDFFFVMEKATQARAPDPQIVLSKLPVPSWFVCVLGSSIITFAIAAPLFLGFLEFILHGSSYKFSGVDTAYYLRINELLADLVLPISGFRAYIGPILGCSVLVGVLAFLRYHFLFALSYFVSALLACRPSFLKDLCLLPPLAWIHPEYFLSAFLFLHCLLCAFGLEFLMRKEINSKNAFLLFLLALVPSMFCIQSIEHHPFAIHISGFYSIRVFVLLTVFAFSIVLYRGKIVSLGLMLANLWLLMGIVPIELPVHKTFQYRKLPSYLRCLKDADSRIVATGNTFFHPNTSMIYGISDLRSIYPIHPSRYFEFVKLCDIEMKYGPMQYTPSRLNRFFDWASVNYVLTDAGLEDLSPSRKFPPEFTAFQFFPNETALKSVLAPGLLLEDFLLDYDPPNNVVVSLRLKSDSKIAFHNPKFFVTDLLNRPVSTTKWIPIEYADEQTNGSLLVRKSLPLNNNIGFGNGFRIYLALSATRQSPLLLPASVQTPFGPGLVLGELTFQQKRVASSVPGSPRFSLMETSKDGFRLYRNNFALPRAYLVHECHSVNSLADATKALMDPALDPRKTVVLETARFNKPQLNDLTLEKSKTDFAQILDDCSDSILLHCRTETPALLVLTDTFYPGWKAWVNNKRAQLYPANLAFRAVEVPRGESFVLMRYEPPTFFVGMHIMYATCFSSVLLLFSGFFLLLKPYFVRSESRKN